MLTSKKVRVLLGGAIVAGAMFVPAVVGANVKAHSGTVIVTLDNTPAGWNNFTSANNDFRVGQIESQVWPSPYLINNHGKFVLNKNYVTAVTSKIVSGHQIVTYTLNKNAKWSDNTPIRAGNYEFMWWAQAGNATWKDKGGIAFDDASNSGYNQIQSVVGSKPSSGGCVNSPAVTAGGWNLPVGKCANGATVTVTFKTGQSYPEYVGLFALLPSHIALQFGWNTGFETGNPLTKVLSAGPYKLSNVNTGANTYTEVRNPLWWGTPAHYPTMVFKDLASDAQGIAGLAAGDYNVFEPTTPNLAMTQEASNYPGTIADSLVQGFQFEHFDFNQNGPGKVDMVKKQVRQAIAYGVNRSALIAATVGQMMVTKQLDNRIVLPNQPGSVKNGVAYDIGGTPQGIAKAISLLKAAGYKYNNSDKWFHKGTTTGPILSFGFWSNGTSARNTEAQIFQGQMRQIGVKIAIHVDPGGNGAILSSGEFDIVVFAWVGSPLLSGNADIYGCTGGSNYDAYCNHAFDHYAKLANTQVTVANETKYYNLADKVLWNDMATLPLYQKPQYGAWTTSVTNVLVNPSSAGIVWNAAGTVPQWAGTA